MLGTIAALVVRGAVNGAALLGLLVLVVGGGSGQLVAGLWVAGIVVTVLGSWSVATVNRVRSRQETAAAIRKSHA
jgi:outer membrane lipoprotein SlyB